MTQVLPLDWAGLDPPGPDTIRMIRTDEANALASRIESKKKNTTVATSHIDYFQISKGMEEKIRLQIEDILFGKCRNMTLKHKNNFVSCKMLPGHRWSDPDNVGPTQTDVSVMNSDRQIIEAVKDLQRQQRQLGFSLGALAITLAITSIAASVSLNLVLHPPKGGAQSQLSQEDNSRICAFPCVRL
jgi:hypothetical protein